MTDYEDDREPPRDIWSYILIYDVKHPLTRFCIGVAACAVLGWCLIQIIAA